MKTYNVMLSRTKYENAVYKVKAEDEEEAAKKAVARAEDYDQPELDWEESDVDAVEADDVEELDEEEDEEEGQ